jgi:hypothetical protein
MSLYFAAGSPTTEFTPAEIKAALASALDKLGARKKVLAVPPDFTRLHSMAGRLTEYAWNYYGDDRPRDPDDVRPRAARPVPGA